MHLPKSTRDNLRFLLAEVVSQLKHLISYFETESISTAQRLLDRSGYAYNLMLRIQNSCTLHISQNRQADTMTLRALSSIATDLERIVELARECIHQLGYLRDSHKLDLLVYVPLLKQVYKSVYLVETALLCNDTQLALKLGRTENKLDKSYKKLLKKYTKKLKNKEYTDDLVTGLFVAHTIEQMGDMLLNISESIISSNIGQPMELQRFESLQNTLNSWLDTGEIADLEIKPVAETRSGSGIKSVNVTDTNNDQRLAIYKEGKKRKLKEEYQGVESWHQIYPGIAPEIFTYQKDGDSAALLIEHLQGVTFEQLLMQNNRAMREAATKALRKTLFSIWDETRQTQGSQASFVAQIRQRLPDIYNIHPYFRQPDSKVGDLPVPGIESLLQAAEKVEAGLPAPFYVYIHGDFNLDNIIFDPETGRINFIDLHRSTYSDYVQDVSVYMVSNYRLQVLDNPTRRRIFEQIRAAYLFARKYAKRNNDEFFEARLALGLARSLVTSTRFILDKTLSKKMFLRAVYLLQSLIQTKPSRLAEYRLLIEDLFYG